MGSAHCDHDLQVLVDARLRDLKLEPPARWNWLAKVNQSSSWQHCKPRIDQARTSRLQSSFVPSWGAAGTRRAHWILGNQTQASHPPQPIQCNFFANTSTAHRFSSSKFCSSWAGVSTPICVSFDLACPPICYNGVPLWTWAAGPIVGTRATGKRD